MSNIDRYKPAVTKYFLILTAGIAWECAGIVLLFLALSWLAKSPVKDILIYSASGTILALLVHHFGFLRIVNKNLQRILDINGKRCFFSFISWKSYLLIVAMIITGTVLRHSIIPKKDLSVLYIGIGLALILSSLRYIRFFFNRNKI